MCGIAGFVDFSGHRPDEARARIKRMTDAIVHRGPDGDGFFVDGTVALGHRRLAIIDLAGGQQPMSALGGQVQIAFNGEIYNFPELRLALEAKGHQFKTHSDTEVILRGYVEWGEQCLERLNGMFAFAIWDARSRSLLLARDRVGKKPLYYRREGSTIAFASELKALRAGGLCADSLDPEALDCYFSLGYIPAPRSIYVGVRKLRAAHCSVISATAERERQYWTLRFGEPKHRPLDDAIDEFESLLDEAVRCRLMSEVPLGAFLSGGLDSSLVVSSMARRVGRPVITNSIGFEEREFSELDAARAVARHLGTDHHEFTVVPQVTEVLEKIAWHCDEPLADSSAVPTWYVCEMTRRNVTVALSGDGGDEAFGGYTFRYLPHLFESKIRAALPPAFRHAAFGTFGRIWPGTSRLPKPLRLKSILENLSVSDAEAFYRDLAWLRSDTRSEIYTADFKDNLRGFEPFEVVQPFYSHNDAPDALGRSQFTDIHVYMTDDVLVKVDRMSMAHSLEVRSPLLDHRILEFAAALPTRLKISGNRGKLLLRGLAARRLPAVIQSLPKRGFAIPAARWLRQDLRSLAESQLFGSSTCISLLLDRTAVRQLWSEHLNGSRDHSVFIWGLIMLGLWEERARSGRA
jgi:asparagine synthase (glutamine-hydrolysing)